MGTGCWQWGDRLYWGYGSGYSEGDLKAAYDASLTAGLSFFDTAEVYGQGRSERLLGGFIRASGRAALVATKFMPFPWRLWKGTLLGALRRSLQRLGLAQADLYQIHWPVPPMSVETWMEALADAVEAGLTRAVGVSNYDVEQMRRASAALAKRGMRLASNQVPYSLLDRAVERNGLLALCRQMGVRLIAYSPLAQGVLSGKYTPAHPPPGARAGRYGRALLARVQPLVGLLRNLGASHGGKTPAQVALNWVICKGALPIPGAKNAAQVRENAGALGWRLTPAEVSALDAMSEQVLRSPS
jgi:aryl-alcohol dehydrogenase-like predicted oxidoreductase